MRKAAFHHLGEENMCPTVQAVLDRAAVIISTPRT
jgi:hypothetical protein